MILYKIIATSASKNVLVRGLSSDLSTAIVAFSDLLNRVLDGYVAQGDEVNMRHYTDPLETELAEKFKALSLMGSRLSLLIFLAPEFAHAQKTDNLIRKMAIKQLLQKRSWVYGAKALLLIKEISPMAELEEVSSPISSPTVDVGTYYTLRNVLGALLTEKQPELKPATMTMWNRFCEPTRWLEDQYSLHLTEYDPEKQKDSSLFEIVTKYLDLTANRSDLSFVDFNSRRLNLENRLEQETIYSPRLLEIISGEHPTITLAQLLNSEYVTLRPKLVVAMLKSQNPSILIPLLSVPRLSENQREDNELRIQALEKVMTLPIELKFSILSTLAMTDLQDKKLSIVGALHSLPFDRSLSAIYSMIIANRDESVSVRAFSLIRMIREYFNDQPMLLRSFEAVSDSGLLLRTFNSELYAAYRESDPEHLGDPDGFREWIGRLFLGLYESQKGKGDIFSESSLTLQKSFLNMLEPDLGADICEYLVLELNLSERFSSLISTDLPRRPSLYNLPKHVARCLDETLKGFPESLIYHPRVLFTLAMDLCDQFDRGELPQFSKFFLDSLAFHIRERAITHYPEIAAWVGDIDHQDLLFQLNLISGLPKNAADRVALTETLLKSVFGIPIRYRFNGESALNGPDHIDEDAISRIKTGTPRYLDHTRKSKTHVIPFDQGFLRLDFRQSLYGDPDESVRLIKEGADVPESYTEADEILHTFISGFADRNRIAEFVHLWRARFVTLGIDDCINRYSKASVSDALKRIQEVEAADLEIYEDPEMNSSERRIMLYDVPTMEIQHADSVLSALESIDLEAQSYIRLALLHFILENILSCGEDLPTKRVLYLLNSVRACLAESDIPFIRLE